MVEKIKLLLLLCLFCMISMGASAQEIPNDEIWYTSSDRKVVTPNYSDVFGANIVSNTYTNGKGIIKFDGNVTEIGERAFDFCRGLTSVTIPNSVTEIGVRAFEYCSGLTSVTIPNSVTSIGVRAFEDCSGLTSVTIPNSVTSIGIRAFSRCSGLASVGINIVDWANKNVAATTSDLSDKSFSYTYNGEKIEGDYTIPDSLTKIVENALYHCKDITKLTIPNSVTEIGERAFQDCSGLTSVTIGNSVTSIGGSAFSDCNNVKELIYAEGTKTILRTYLTSITSVTIGNSVTEIGERAFQDCSGLTSVTIPNSVTSIGEGAFYNCSGLTSVTIGNSVTSIGNYAFSECNNVKELIYAEGTKTILRTYLTSITSVTIPNSVTSIGNYAFDGCSLKSLTIGTGVLSIGNGEINSIKTIWLCNTPPNGYNKVKSKINYAANDLYTGLNNTKVYPLLSSLFIVDGIKYALISAADRTCDAIDCVYDNTAINAHIDKTVTNKSVTLKVLNINDYACYQNPYIKGVAINNNGYVGAYAFYKCDSIKNLTCSNDGYIGESAFENSGVKVATVTNTAEIKNRAFYNCTILEQLEASNNGYIGDKAFYGTTALDTALISNKGHIGTSAFENSGVKVAKVHNKGAVVDRAFYNCARLQDISLGDSITTLGNSVFYACKSLPKVVIPDNITAMGQNIFQNCEALTSVHIGSGIPEVKIYAFSGCSSLPEIEIPKNVNSIGNYSFEGCTSLSDVIFADRTTALILGSNGSNPLFKDCPLDSVYIGAKIQYNTSESYGYSPFYRNTSLRTIVITDEEEKVYDNEFYGCDGLKSVSIGNGTTSIGNWAFSGCSNLDYFEFGQKTATIGEEAFSDCVNITKIISHAITPPVCGYQALDDISKWTCTLIVPKGHLEKYQQADQWKEFFFTEESGEEETILATSVTIDKDKCECPVGETLTLTATVLPEDATDKSVTWSSDNESVATVADGVVTAVAIGTANITAKTNDGSNLSASCKITVEQTDTPGTDFTSKLINPDYSQGSTGWSGTYYAVSDNCAESWDQSSFDMYQIVKGAPVGCYEISVQGFYREFRGDNAWNAYFYKDGTAKGEITSKAYVYLNDAQTPLCNVFEEKVAAGSLFSDSEMDNHLYTDPNGKYEYPNNMTNAHQAFDAGLYTNSAFGLIVQNGDEMRIGVKGNTSTGDDSWAIWSNFRLTYHGFKANIIKPVLEKKIEGFAIEGLMGSDVRAEAKKILATAKEALTLTDGEVMFAALADIYKSESKMSESITLFAKLVNQNTILFDAIRASKSDEETKTEATLLWSEIDDALMAGTYTDADAKAKLEEIAAMIIKLKLPAGYQDASDNNPVDFTSIISTPSFDKNGVNSVEGWTIDGTDAGYNFGNDNFQKSALALEFFEKGDYNMYQSFTDLPNGTYKVEMNAFFRLGTSKADYAAYQNKEKGHAMMYAKTTENDSIENYICLCASDAASEQIGVGAESQLEDGTFTPNDMVSAVAYFDNGHYYNGIYVKVVDGTLRFGITQKRYIASGWMIMDNWTLTYYGTESKHTEGPINYDALFGDANDDGIVNVNDITTIATFILKGTADSWNEVNADANCDGIINVNDITATATIILGGETTQKAKSISLPESMTIELNSTHQLSATILPKTAIQKVSWKSSNESIATVSQDGIVTGKAIGQATITATTTDGTYLSASCVVTVQEKDDIVYYDYLTGIYGSRVGKINTGIFITNNYVIECEFQIDKLPNSGEDIGIWGTADEVNCTRVIFCGGGLYRGRFVNMYHLSDWASQWANTNLPTGHYNMRFKDVAYVYNMDTNQTIFSSAGSRTFTSTSPLCLFDYDGGRNTCHEHIKIGHTKVYNGNTLQRDLRPCLFNGEIGMFDSVTNEFFKMTDGVGKLGNWDDAGDDDNPDDNPDDSYDITRYISASRTGISITATSSGIYYQVSFEIRNNSIKTIHLESLAGVGINNDLGPGQSYSITLQSTTSYLKDYYQTLIYTYNGKTYTLQV